VLFRSPNVLVVEFSHENKSPDIIWGQLKRTTNAITKQLELAHFEVVRSSCITDEKNSAALGFLLESVTLPQHTKKRGPDVFRRSDTASFLSNTKSKPLAIWVDKEMKVTMLVERKATDARKIVESLLQPTNYDKKNNRDKGRLDSGGGGSGSGGGGGGGISKDLIVNRLQIYIGSDRKIIKGLAKEVISRVVATERLIFK
jgi:tRNA nucleotidyltransferase (CCA-adding enzyme)